MTASSATRERKEDIKKFLLNFLKQHRNKRDIQIMNLASGPAREIKESLDVLTDNSFPKVTFDCYDFDHRALDYARQLLNNIPNVNFIQKNAIRIGLKKDIKQEIPQEYDLIYSMGLFDYLDEKIATRLIANLRKCLKKDGVIIIGNFGEKYSNSSAGLMEWATEWYLIYRTDYELRRIFTNAGFSANALEITSQPSKVIKYCFAKNA
jgi:chemotaxis methyl-accepting protein methylase